MAYIRKQYHTLKERIEEPRKFIQVLEKLVIPSSIEVADAVDAKDSDWIHRVWDSARAMMMIRGEQERLLVIAFCGIFPSPKIVCRRNGWHLVGRLSEVRPVSVLK